MKYYYLIKVNGSNKEEKFTLLREAFTKKQKDLIVKHYAKGDTNKIFVESYKFIKRTKEFYKTNT